MSVAAEATPGNRTGHRLAGIRPAITSETAARLVAPSIIALSALVLVWTRLMVLGQGLWGDEAGAVVRYIDPGPSAIWSSARWIPNNHVLFDFLSWITVSVIGARTEPLYRVWSVVPAIAGAGLLTWWLWRRFDRWTAAIFAVLVTVAPMYFDLSVQARGYGLAYLASAMVIVGAGHLLANRPRSGLLLFAVGGFIGIAALPTFVALFVGTALVLLTDRRLRRAVGISVVSVGAVALLWYAPLLAKIINYNNQLAHGGKLPWYGFVDAPFRDQLGSGIHTLLPSVSITAGAIFAGVLLAAAVLTLWRAGQWRLAAVLLIPPLTTYLEIQFSTGYLPRFGSFVLFGLLALAAVGIGIWGRRLARSRRAALVLVTLLAVCSLLVLGRFANYAATFTQRPFEDAHTAGLIVTGDGVKDSAEPVITNYDAAAFAYYAAPRRVRLESAASLLSMFCDYQGRFIYFDQASFQPAPSTTCLIKRGSFRILLPERRSRVFVWLVPRMPASHGRS